MICDVPGGVDEIQLRDVEELALDLARLGFRAVSISPASQELAWDEDAALATFVARMHRVGLKVVVRLAGPILPPSAGDSLDLNEGVTTLVGRFRACIAAGVDGIDLGLITPPVSAHTDTSSQNAPWDAARFSRLIRILLAELGNHDNAPVLLGESSARTPEELSPQLRENAFHLLRDACMECAPWDAHTLYDIIASSYRVRDWADRANAWTWSRMHHAHDPLSLPLLSHPSSDFFCNGSWEQGAPSARRDAMGLFALSLPGSAHVPLLDVGGDVLVDADTHVHRVWADRPSRQRRHELVGLVLRTRAQRSMGAGSLATVDGLPWAHEGVGVHIASGVLVVLNTSDRVTYVPTENRLLVSSTGDEAIPGRPFPVPPESCAWFESAQVRPPVPRLHE